MSFTMSLIRATMLSDHFVSRGSTVRSTRTTSKNENRSFQNLRNLGRLLNLEAVRSSETSPVLPLPSRRYDFSQAILGLRTGEPDIQEKCLSTLHSSLSGNGSDRGSTLQIASFQKAAFANSNLSHGNRDSNAAFLFLTLKVRK